jgi:hypothetical protein
MRLRVVFTVVFCGGYALTTAHAQTPPTVDSAVYPFVESGDVVLHTFTQTGGTPPITWDNFRFGFFVPSSGEPDDGPLHPATFDPETQLFRWDTSGSPLGVYVWFVRAGNAAGFDQGAMEVSFLLPIVPEPTGVSLVGVGMILLARTLRWRRR